MSASFSCKTQKNCHYHTLATDWSHIIDNNQALFADHVTTADKILISDHLLVTDHIFDTGSTSPITRAANVTLSCNVF